ncbi:LysR family transcriptional regulator [Aliiglaciecola litoralis]|uniref:LysR family transcriptional regulator n=1 Tax=Aliiglaciecola litoralis TaxID=582857 RepID=A0ABN1LHM0_9ALTE
MPDLKQIQQLDLNLLKVFESLYQEQNMTRCAERLHITPSAVSHAIKRLRLCLEDPLFERSQNRMLPTPACQRMAPMILDNLSRLRQILQQWGEFEPQTSTHHFRIGMHDAIEPAVLPQIAHLLAHQAPHTTFASVKVERSQLTRALASGHIDMALDVAMPINLPVRHEKVFDDSFSILVDKHHEMVNLATQQAYFDAQHVSVSHRPSGAVLEDLILQQQGMARQLVVRCQNYYAAKEMIKHTDWLLTAPTSLANRLKDEQLHLLAMPFTMPTIETHMYWHENTEHDRALTWFRQLVSNLKG